MGCVRGFRKMYVMVLGKVDRIYGNKWLLWRCGPVFPRAEKGRMVTGGRIRAEAKNAARAARGRPTAPGGAPGQRERTRGPHPQSSGLGRVES